MKGKHELFNNFSSNTSFNSCNLENGLKKVPNSQTTVFELGINHNNKTKFWN